MTQTPLSERLAQVLRQRPGDASSDFDLNPDFAPPKRDLRAAAVLIAIVGIDADNPQIVLTKRASHLKHHPGQISFPGGKVEGSDPNIHAAALREAEEEISLAPERVQIIGELASHETVTGFSVTPVLGAIEPDFVASVDPNEVAEAFFVPLDHVLNPQNYLVQSRRWRGTNRAYYVVPYGPYYIWGATARMLRGLAHRMEQVS